MVKKFFKFFSALLFFILIFLSGAIEFLLFPKDYLYLLVILISPFFLLPWLFPKYKGSNFRKIITHFSFFTLLFSFFYVGQVVVGNFRGIERFNYQVGNVTGILKLFAHTAPGQAGLKKLYSFFPYSTQMLIYAAEDATRVITIQKRIEGSFCKEMDRYLCLKQILFSINTHAPLTSTGQILMVAVGAKIISDIKKKNKKNLRTSILSVLNIIELSRMTLTAVQSSSRINKVLPDFPNEEVDKLPREKTDKLDAIVNQSKYPMYLGHNLRDIEHAYVAKKVDSKINLKFETAIKEKILQLRSELVKKIDSKTYKNEANDEELIALEKRIRAL